MKVFAHQRWEDYSGVVLMDNLGLADHRLEELLGMGFTTQISVVSQRSLIEELVLLLYEQGVFEERGAVVLPGRGGKRVWRDFSAVASELDLSLQSWRAAEIDAVRVVQGGVSTVAIGDLAEEAISTGSEWVAILDDVVSSGVTAQGVREKFSRFTQAPCKVIAPLVNLGRNNPTMVGFSEVYGGLAVRGCGGRDRVPIASLLGFVEREGWARCFAEKYARDPQRFESFWAR